MLTYPGPDFISALGQAFIARRLARLSDSFVDDIEAFLRASGLTAPARGFSTLLLIGDAPGLGIVQIARQVQMSHPLMINLLSQLEHQRLIVFRPDENDRRRRLVFLTPEGETEVSTMRSALPTIRAAYGELSREINIDLLSLTNRLDEALDRRSFRQRLDGIAGIRADLGDAPEHEK